MQTAMEHLLAALIGIVFGSIPFGLILTRSAGLGDIRDIGSGSIGATNVLRTGNKGLAAATVLLDAGKGVAAVLIAGALWPGNEGWAAIGAIVGHCFPVWLRFKGGKGFATAAGVLAALAWPVVLVCAAVWAATLALSKTSSVSSLVAVIAAPVAAWAMGYPGIVWVLVVVAGIVIVQHRENIARLRAGTEPKVGRKS
jgi:glycerol-3-phosphate acyltransferase PlsY